MNTIPNQKTVTRRRKTAVIPATDVHDVARGIGLTSVKVWSAELGPLRPDQVDGARRLLISQVAQGSRNAAELLSTFETHGVFQVAS
jgi:hypothetical protein